MKGKRKDEGKKKQHQMAPSELQAGRVLKRHWVTTLIPTRVMLVFSSDAVRECPVLWSYCLLPFKFPTGEVFHER